MKKLLRGMLLLILCMSLTACGKTEAVKNVETMIDTLGEVTTESGDAIFSIDEAYNALTEEEKPKVKNYTTFLTARDSYYTLMLPGEWMFARMDLWTMHQSDRQQDFVLHSDMTWEGNMCGYASGTWSVTNGEIRLQETNRDFEYGSFKVSVQNGIVGMKHLYDDRDGLDYMRAEDYEAYVKEFFLVVDLAESDLSEYMEFTVYDEEITDEWGDPTGTSYRWLMIKSKLYDQGWLFQDVLGDFAIEVLIPAYSVTDGYSDTNTYDPENVTVTYNPFEYNVFRIGYWSENYQEECELDLEQVEFGRAKGKLIFINSKYVTVTTDDSGNSRILKWYDDFCSAEYYSGSLNPDLPY